MASVKSLDKRLRQTLKALNNTAADMLNLSMETKQQDLDKVASALEQVLTLQYQMYAARPKLIPRSNKKQANIVIEHPDFVSTYMRVQAFEHIKDIKAAIVLLKGYLDSTPPPQTLKMFIETEMSRLDRKKGVDK